MDVRDRRGKPSQMSVRFHFRSDTIAVGRTPAIIASSTGYTAPTLLPG
jgi:hypothetical protein